MRNSPHCRKDEDSRIYMDEDWVAVSVAEFLGEGTALSIPSISSDSSRYGTMPEVRDVKSSSSPSSHFDSRAFLCSTKLTNQEPAPDLDRHTSSKFMFGIGLILVVALIWVAASEWIQYIFGSLNYSKPYFLTYFNTTGFCFWNFGFFSRSWQSVPWKHHQRKRTLDGGHGLPEAPTPKQIPWATTDTPPFSAAAVPTIHSGVSPSDSPSLGTVPIFPADMDACNAAQHCAEHFSVKRCKYSLHYLVVCAVKFCPLWFLANWLFNFSLAMTSVSSNTILSATSSIWTLLLSWIFLGNKNIGVMSIVAVILCFSGSCIVGLADSNASQDGPKESFLGDLLALLSAFFYGAYSTALNRLLPDDDRYHMGMVFSILGVVNFLCMWPGLAILHVTGVERFQFPPMDVFWPLLLNALIGTNLSDVLWAKSVVLTSPVVATLGLALTTPLSMLTDALLCGKGYSWAYILGAFLVMIGFLFASMRCEAESSSLEDAARPEREPCSEV